MTAHLSPHFTAALVVDAGQRWQTAAEEADAAIRAAVDRAIARSGVASTAREGDR